MTSLDTSPLTTAQRELMEIVWASGEVTVTEVRDLLEPKRNLARNTVLTMMVRLEERGWLQHRTQGRTFVYSAARPKTASLGMRVSQMVDRLFAGSPEDLVTALIEYRGLTAAETERIRTMIEQAESKQKQSENRRKNQP
ncbi:BlaI/MecI/CopY family transcriptional regulator [Gimesia sp.]|uniref:BlaI/MecI/CopY family transcriptional regulator n=1 Tax=Gimesia sp. TaxID=2024833 RepID=UPI000C5100AC|nr:BlaI/MecI/CopY family transcriptional regulator [Gimesia sp.]MAX37750.1 penicillinase repressor [Gimesia sp.]HAH46571.1 penicillinase repressor [Planctomycetaceae bacterium]HBL46358.1 penicillinase repressor [Planctomycetaceae bacterium]